MARPGNQTLVWFERNAMPRSRGCQPRPLAPTLGPDPWHQPEQWRKLRVPIAGKSFMREATGARAMAARKIGIIVEGATGRLGATQHLRSLMGISGEGGL